MLKSASRPLLALGAFSVSMSASVAAASGPTPAYLLNSGFDQPMSGTAAGDTTHNPAICIDDGYGHGGWSASEAWTTWSGPGHTVTSKVDTTPDGLFTANLVYTSSGGGLVQVLSQSPSQASHIPDNTLTDVNAVGAWVWVVHGQVDIQLRNGGGAGGGPNLSQTTGTWEWVGGCGRADGLNNEVTIYGSSPSLFFVDDAMVYYDPAC